MRELRSRMFASDNLTRWNRFMTDARDRLQQFLDTFIAAKEKVHVLEAGCGSATHVNLGPRRYTVGIDIEQRQLDRNVQLDERILGDIQTYELPRDTFDIVICWDVLEHLPNPERAIDKFCSAVKPGGIVIIAAPNLFSIKGLITRFTPHWVHVWVYRHIYGNPNAGTNGQGPFKTFLRYASSPTPLRKRFKRAGFTEELFCLYPSTMITGLRRRSGAAYVLYGSLRLASKAVTLGHHDGNASDLIGVYRKPLGE